MNDDGTDHPGAVPGNSAQKAGRQAFWVVVPGLVLAALAAGYWSATVCMTLLGAALFTAVTTKALRFYYMRKF